MIACNVDITDRVQLTRLVEDSRMSARMDLLVTAAGAHRQVPLTFRRIEP